jgi:hypothetical protein
MDGGVRCEPHTCACVGVSQPLQQPGTPPTAHQRSPQPPATRAKKERSVSAVSKHARHVESNGRAHAITRCLQAQGALHPTRHNTRQIRAVCPSVLAHDSLSVWGEGECTHAARQWTRDATHSPALAHTPLSMQSPVVWLHQQRNTQPPCQHARRTAILQCAAHMRT